MEYDNPEVFSLVSCTLTEDTESKFHTNDSPLFIEYVLSGTETIESPDVMLSCTSGALIIIPPGDECVIYHSPKGFKAVRIEADGTLFKAVLDSLDKHGAFSRYVPCHERIFRIHSLSEQYFLSDKTVTEEICTLLFSVIFSSCAAQVTFDGKLSAEKIKEYIHLKMFEDIDLDTLSVIFGVTKIHVIRVFKEKYDMSPMQYLKEERLLYAEKLLTDTDLPIKTVAALMNYSGTQHFTNLFRERFGTSPGKYRNNKRNK